MQQTEFVVSQGFSRSGDVARARERHKGTCPLISSGRGPHCRQHRLATALKARLLSGHHADAGWLGSLSRSAAGSWIARFVSASGYLGWAQLALGAVLRARMPFGDGPELVKSRGAPVRSVWHAMEGWCFVRRWSLRLARGRVS